MAKIELYSKSYCPYCMQAKALFEEKGVEFEVHDVTDDSKKQAEMMERSEGKLMTVPQIYINDKLIGGYSDLATLDEDGELDELLAG